MFEANMYSMYEGILGLADPFVLRNASNLDPASPPLLPCYLLYHILVIFVCLIFFCSWKIPYISASDVGGHPGT